MGTQARQCCPVCRKMRNGQYCNTCGAELVPLTAATVFIEIGEIVSDVAQRVAAHRHPPLQPIPGVPSTYAKDVPNDCPDCDRYKAAGFDRICVAMGRAALAYPPQP